jgi:ATP-dependent Lon protease
MSSFDDVTKIPDDFSGRLRLFPLPDLVVFPHAMQPLHIFEPRYCEMLDDAMATDKLIGMATLIGGSSGGPKSPPAIHPMVCIGKVVSHAETESGTYNILLIGARRARVIRELKTDQPFRVAEIELLPEFAPPPDSPTAIRLKSEVLDAFASAIPASAAVQQNLHELMASQMGLGPITDIIAFTLPLGTSAKLKLLEQNDVAQRAIFLAELLRRFSKPTSGPSQHPGGAANSPPTTPSRPEFPPPFSLN